MIKKILLLLILITLITAYIATIPSASTASIEKAPMQVARSSLGVATVYDKIYAIGGDARQGKWPYQGSIVGTNEEYNPSTNTWTTKSLMPTPRSNFAIATVGGKIYCFGGITAIDDKGRQITNAVEVYNPTTDTWTIKSDMPTQRWDVQANVINGKIYLMGGYKPENTSYSEALTDLNEVYDPKNDSWSTAKQVPIAASFSGSAVMDGKIHLIDGRQMGSLTLLHFIYDPTTNSWSSAYPSPTPTGYGAAAATTGINSTKLIYVFGKTGDLWEDNKTKTRIDLSFN